MNSKQLCELKLRIDNDVYSSTAENILACYENLIGQTSVIAKLGNAGTVEIDFSLTENTQLDEVQRVVQKIKKRASTDKVTINFYLQPKVAKSNYEAVPELQCVMDEFTLMHIVDRFLFDDELFLQDICNCLDKTPQEVSNETWRREFFKGDCVHNGARSYIFQMLVFKHMYRLCKYHCKDFLDPYWQGKVDAGCSSQPNELSDADKEKMLALAATCKTISIPQIQKNLHWGFNKAARALDWYNKKNC